MQLPPGAVRVRDLMPPAADRLPEVDEAHAVIRRVKLIGTRGLNKGREYPPDVLARAARLYEGAAVNVNHLRPGQANRDYLERLGWFENVEPAADGLYGDLHYNPHHREAAGLVWWARNNPRACGFSPDQVVRRTTNADGTERVTDILAVLGIDLVADPSTTAGLTEALNLDPSITAEPGSNDFEAQVGKLVAAIICDPDLTPDQKKKKILVALKLMDDTPEEAPAETPAAETPSPEAFDPKAFAKSLADGLTAGFNTGVARLVEANKGFATQVTEALKGRPADGVVSHAREAQEVAAQPAGPKDAPPLADLLSKVRADGTW